MLQDIRDFDDPKIRKIVRKERTKADHMDLFGQEPPADLLTPYRLDRDGLERSAKLQQKYVQRARNIRRCWNRVQLYLPEMIGCDASLDVLEMSTAHGGMLEILRHFGHSVTGNDYANMVSRRHGQAMSQFRALNDRNFSRVDDDMGLPIPSDADTVPDWPYRHIVEAIDIPIRIFDAGKTPYPFADKSMDVVMCLQAIEHYCHPRDWMPIIDEFCRISRKTVFVLLNRLIPEFAAQDEYRKAFDDFRLQMRSYNRNGFTCVANFVHWNAPLGFKLMAL